MIARGEILRSVLYRERYWWELKTEIFHLNITPQERKYYRSKEAAKRAARRVAKELNIEIDWVKGLEP